MFRGFEDFGRSKVRFDFTLGAGKRMILELKDVAQVDSLPNLDSLMKDILEDLRNFSDTLNIPLANKTVDVVSGLFDRRYRIRVHPQAGSIYQASDSGIVQLKVEQDTLQIRLFTLGGPLKSLGGRLVHNYQISFLMNHLLPDLEQLTTTISLQSAIGLLKQDLALKMNRPKKGLVQPRYFAQYDVTKGKRSFPNNGHLVNHGRQVLQLLPPYVQTGFQYVRGAWSPSAGVGLEIVHRVQEDMEKRYRLYWEPHFFFEKNAQHRTVLQRNDFLTFKHQLNSTYRDNSREIQFKQTFSLGYLIRRRGDYFEPTTFKFSLPGLQAKNILLEPEFFFNRLLRNFSPSMKLTLVFE